MTQLFLPDSTPPKATPEAAEHVIDALLSDGLAKVYDDSLFLFRDRHPSFREYLQNFSFEQNNQPVNNPFTYDAFRIGVVITSLTYHVSGYEEAIDEQAIITGELGADLEGVPQAYLTRFVSDTELQRVMSVLPDTPYLQQDLINGEYDQILAIGAGCTRFYMQQAVAA